MKQLSRPFILAAVVALVLSGCTSQGSGVTGKWGSTDAGQPNLTVNSDGAFTGSDGCNTLTGKGTISGNTITFGPFASTLKACAGVDEWLNKAATASADGNVMTVKNSSGSKIGTLDRNG